MFKESINRIALLTILFVPAFAKTATVECVTSGNGEFASISKQVEGPLYNCFYGCQPTETYGFTFYLTNITATNDLSPRVQFGTLKEGSKFLSDLNAEVAISFLPSQAFFDFANEFRKFPEAVEILNTEAKRLQKENFVASLKELKQGVVKHFSAGILMPDKTVRIVNAMSTCIARDVD